MHMHCRKHVHVIFEFNEYTYIYKNQNLWFALVFLSNEFGMQNYALRGGTRSKTFQFMRKLKNMIFEMFSLNMQSCNVLCVRRKEPYVVLSIHMSYIEM